MSEAASAWVSYRRLRLLVDAEVARDVERGSGLSMADFEVLTAVVAVSGEQTCVRVSGLAARMYWAHSRLSRQLGRMERRGLIAREHCELDGRGDDVVLTEAGRRAFDQAAPVHQESVDRHFGGLLSAPQLAALDDIAQTIAGRLRSGPGPA